MSEGPPTAALDLNELLRARALVVELNGVPLAIAGLDDVIAMKRASGRPADLRDIAVLTALEGA